MAPVQPDEAGFTTTGLARVDRVMQAGLDAVFPAAALLVARHGGVIFHRAYGYLDPEIRRRATTVDALFDLASLTKLFTTTAFMRLVERGQVGMDTPVGAVLPELRGKRQIGVTEDPLSKTCVAPDPAYAGQTADLRSITFWHLLTHTSGLAAWRSLYRENGGSEAVPLPHQVPTAQRQRRLAAISTRYDLAYPPGARIVYSDLGLILLGEAIARLAGTSLETAVRSLVLEPLGLRRTTYNPLAHGVPAADIVPTEFCQWRRRRCAGEVHDENAASLGGVAGHAGLFSTAREVAVLGQLYLDGGTYAGTRLLRPATVAEMTRVQVDMDDNPRGLGWLQRSQGSSSSGHLFGPHSFGHTGFTGTSLWIDPDQGLVVALLTNRVYHGRDPAGIQDFRPRLHDAVVAALQT